MDKSAKMDWEMQKAVQGVIELLLPFPDMVDHSHNDSVGLVFDLILVKYKAIWHKKTEQENLKALRRALIQAQRAWHRLHPGLREVIRSDVFKASRERETAHESQIDAVVNSEVLYDIADFYEPSLRHAKISINYGLSKGRTGWEEILVIDHCRKIWHRRTGKDAPTLGLDVSAPFGLFTKEIFKVCKLKFSHARFDAWVKVQNSE